MQQTRILFIIIALCAIALAAFDPRSGRAADIPRQLMTVGVPIAVPRAVGRFEQLIVDDKYRRLIAVHASSNELLVVNLDSGEVERRVVVGPGRGVAIDVFDGKILVSTDDNYVSQLNRRWLVENQRIYLSGPVGSVAFDSKRNRLYASQVDGTQLWVIQAKADKLTQFPVAVPKGPSSIVYEPLTDRLYQNITSINSVIVIDPSTNTVVGTWPLGEATDPRGIAVDYKGRRLFSAGSNGKLDVLDLATGKVISTIDIPPRNDQIAYDAGLNTLYCASGVGLLTVVGETGQGFNRIGDVTIPRGAVAARRSVAVALTGTVLDARAADERSCIYNLADVTMTCHVYYSD